jgi:hypothetical protein
LFIQRCFTTHSHTYVHTHIHTYTLTLSLLFTGRDGQPGIDGQAGSLVISIVNVETGEVEEFPSVYKFELQSIANFCSLSGIIEPGQRVAVNSFVVVNKGGMPTPQTNMIVTMHGNSVIMVDEKEDRHSWNLLEKLYPEKTMEITEPRYFKIASGLKSTVPTEVLYLKSDLKMSARYVLLAVPVSDNAAFNLI